MIAQQSLKHMQHMLAIWGCGFSAKPEQLCNNLFYFYDETRKIFIRNAYFCCILNNSGDFSLIFRQFAIFSR